MQKLGVARLSSLVLVSAVSLAILGYNYKKGVVTFEVFLPSAVKAAREKTAKAAWEKNGRISTASARAAAGRVHVAYATDAGSLAGLRLSLLTLASNMAKPKNCTVHLVVPRVVVPEVTKLIGCVQHTLRLKGKLAPKMTIVEERPELYTSLQYMNNFFVDRLSNKPSVFSRLLLSEYLPDVPKVIYLDTDTLVTGDIAELFRQPLSHALGAVIQTNDTFELLYTKLSAPAVHLTKDHVPDFNKVIFNSGVLSLDLDSWRRRGIAASLLQWGEVLESSDDQLFLNLEFQFKHGFDKLDPKWNLYNIGRRGEEAKILRLARRAKILHWAGPRKPWRKPWRDRGVGSFYRRRGGQLRCDARER